MIRGGVWDGLLLAIYLTLSSECCPCVQDISVILCEENISNYL